MAEHDDPQTDVDEAEVSGFGLVGGLLGDGSVLPNPTNLGPAVSVDFQISKVVDCSSAVVYQRSADAPKGKG